MKGTQPRNQFLESDSKWQELAKKARTYAVAEAWQLVYRLLYAPLSEYSHGKYAPAKAVECLCLLMMSCWGLGRIEQTRILNEILLGIEKKESSIPGMGTGPFLYCRARYEIEFGDYRKALVIVRNAFTQLQDSEDRWCRIRVALLRSKVETRCGHYGIAEEVGLFASIEAQALQCERLQADAYFALANIARTRGALEEGTALYSKATALYWRTNNVNAHAKVLLCNAICLMQQGSFGKAKALYAEALSLSRARGNVRTVLKAEIGLGKLYQCVGDLRASRRLLLRAWIGARRNHMRRDAAVALEYLAETYVALKNIAKAVVALNCCKKVIVGLAPDGDVAAEVCGVEVLISLAKRRPWIAIPHARRIAKKARQAGMKWEYTQALRLLGIGLVMEGKKQKSKAILRQCYELQGEMGAFLDAQLTLAWINALDVSLRKRRRIEQSGERRRQLAADLIEYTNSSKALLDCNEYLAYQMNHAVTGPIPWLLNKRRVKSVLPARRQALSMAVNDGNCNDQGSVCARSGPKSLQQKHWDQLGLLTKSPILQECLWLAETYAAGKLPVLVLGETGTGKDLVARGIHKLSGVNGQYVPVNCAAAHGDLFIGELFGAMKGAYTGAFKDRCGLIHEAEHGSLFFDEVADLALGAQGLLLRFLDSGEIRRIGELRSQCIHTRVLAATCRDLAGMVLRGEFRADLYERLSAFTLGLPPLRQRPEDLELLIERFWALEGGDLASCQSVFTEKVIKCIRKELWPGNVRQLKHFVERVRLRYERFFPDDSSRGILRAVFIQSVTEEASRICAFGSPIEGAKKKANPGSHRDSSNKAGNWDRRLLEDALDEAGGFIPEAGRLLGLSRSHAYRLLGPIKRRNSS